MLKHCSIWAQRKIGSTCLTKFVDFSQGTVATARQSDKENNVAVEQRGREKCGKKEIVQNVCFNTIILVTCPDLGDVQSSVSSRIQRPTHSEKGEWETIGILFFVHGSALNHKEPQSLVHEEV